MMSTKEKRLYLYCLIASIGGFLFGFDIAIFSGAIPFIQPELQLSHADLGWVASSLYVGCALGTVLFGKITERLGRKKSFLLVSLIFAISSIAMGLSNDMNTLVVWRIIAGFSVGGASILSPMYIAEISPKEKRGRMVSINQLAIVIGILSAYITNYFLSFTEWNWRLMFMSGILPALLFLIFLPFLPESPKWLIYRKKTTEGKKILAELLEKTEVDQEISYIKKQDSAQTGTLNFSQIFKSGFGGLLLVAIVVAIFQQISGANAVLFYAPIIFEKAGMDVSSQLFQQILIGAINLVSTLIAMKYVDRIGRKKLLLIGSGLMSVLLVLIGLSFGNLYFPSSILSVFVILFIGVYAATLGPLTWVVITEIFPISIRATAVSTASAFLWIACFSLTYLFPIMVNTFDITNTFLIFSALCFVYFLFLIFFLNETKNNHV